MPARSLSQFVILVASAASLATGCPERGPGSTCTTSSGSAGSSSSTSTSSSSSGGTQDVCAGLAADLGIVPSGSSLATLDSDAGIVTLYFSANPQCPLVPGLGNIGYGELGIAFRSSVLSGDRGIATVDAGLVEAVSSCCEGANATLQGGSVTVTSFAPDDGGSYQVSGSYQLVLGMPDGGCPFTTQAAFQIPSCGSP